MANIRYWIPTFFGVAVLITMFVKDYVERRRRRNKDKHQAK